MNIFSHWHLLVVFLCASLAHHKGSLSVVILNISVINVFDNHYHFWWVLSGDPTGYGAATSRFFTIYENFSGKIVSVLLEYNFLFFL
ncbi:hypothetical protein, partial [Escherichia coli]